MKEVNLVLDGATMCVIHVAEEAAEDLETFLEAVTDRIVSQQDRIEHLIESLDYYCSLI